MIVTEKKAPGQKMIKKMPLRTKWILTSILSFSIIGLGLSFFVFSWNRLQTKQNHKAPRCFIESNLESIPRKNKKT